MSDPFLAELWANAPPPWNELGPQIAARVRAGVLTVRASASGFPTNVPESQLTRWSRQLREARKASGMIRRAVAHAAGMTPYAVWSIECGRSGKEASGWARLAAFYGITLE